VAQQGGDDQGGDAGAGLLGRERAVGVLGLAQEGDGLVAHRLEVLGVGAGGEGGRGHHGGYQGGQQRSSEHGAVSSKWAGRTGSAKKVACRASAGRKRPRRARDAAGTDHPFATGGYGFAAPAAVKGGLAGEAPPWQWDLPAG